MDFNRHRIGILLILLLFPAGCTDGLHQKDDNVLNFTIDVDEKNETRSILPETETFENAIHEVTLMAYDSRTGILEEAGYSSGKSCPMLLNKNKEYILYALVNMGDLTGKAPLDMENIGKVSYVMPSFEDLASKGIPMASSTLFTTEKPEFHINVRRLAAKMSVTINYSDMNSAGASDAFAGGSVKVHKAAKTLYPFAEGGSAALSADDLFPSVSDYETVSNPYSPISEELVLYIPENIQRDITNKDLCTYLSFSGLKIGTDDGVSGELVYRFIPSADGSEVCGLEGGKVYNTNLTLTWDGMYMTGSWKVERSSWSDKRRISVSAAPDGPYSSELTLNLPPGVKDHPYYIFYTVNDEEYVPGSGVSKHKNYGWTFSSGNLTAPDCHSVLSLPEGIECGFSRDETLRARHSITIPQNSSLIGGSCIISYHTFDGRRQCTFRINIVKPSIILDKDEVIRKHSGWSTLNMVTVAVCGGSVPAEYISVSSDNSNLKISGYDSSTGILECYWTSQNSDTTKRTANLTFRGLGASASCKVHQQGLPSLSAAEDEDGGGADIEF